MADAIQQIAIGLEMDASLSWAFLVRKKAEKYEIFAFKREELNPHLWDRWGCFLREADGTSHGLGIYDSALEAIKACEFHQCWSSNGMEPFLDQYANP